MDFSHAGRRRFKRLVGAGNGNKSFSPLLNKIRYGAKAYGEKSSRGCRIFRVSRRVGIRQKGEEVENADRNKGVSDIVPSDRVGNNAVLKRTGNGGIYICIFFFSLSPHLR